MNPLKINLQHFYHIYPNSVIFNEYIYSATSSTSEESSLPSPPSPPFPFSGTEILEMLWEWFFFSPFFFFPLLSVKPDYFTCQSTILGKEEISKKGSALGQSSKQKEQQKSFTPEWGDKKSWSWRTQGNKLAGDWQRQLPEYLKLSFVKCIYFIRAQTCTY